MIIKVNKGNVEPIDAPYTITSYSNSLTVTGDIPSDAFVTVVINEIPWEFFIFLEYKDGVFKGEIIFPENVLEFLRTSKFEFFNFKIKINGFNINGEIPFKINFKSLLKNGKTIKENDYKLLKQDLFRIQRKLDCYIGGMFHNSLETYQENIKEGMVPIALDSQGNYKWDFPFSNLENVVRNLTNLVKELSQIQVQNVEKINQLELDLFNLKNNNFI